jgi:hypothetical protein
VRATRVITVAAIALLVALVASAVTLAATAPGPAQIVPSRLVVGAGPPTTATGVVTITSSSGISITADGAFDFPAGTADVTATASLSIVTATSEVRLADRALYLNVAPFASLIGAPWVTTGSLHGAARLDALADALRHPDLARLHPKHRVVVHAPGGTTTTTMAFGRVHLPSTAGLPIALPRAAALTVVVTTGAQGQVLAVAVHLANPGDDVRLTARVTGYGVPVSVVAPPASEVAPLDGRRARAIFGTDAQGIERRLGQLRRLVARLG